MNRIGTLLLTLVSASIAPHSFSASFDCTKAQTSIEKQICSDKTLGNLDETMAQNYKNMRAANIGDDARKSLHESQRRWLIERNKCRDTTCLKNIYAKRLDEICAFPVLSGVYPVCTSSGELSGPSSSDNKQDGIATLKPRALFSGLRDADNPQKYFELGVCFESLRQLSRRGDNWKLDSTEVKRMDNFFSAVGVLDTQSKGILLEFCPAGPNQKCFDKMPLNNKAFLDGTGKVVLNFRSSEPNDLISSKGPGNNPLIQRNIMHAYCEKYGY